MDPGDKEVLMYGATCRPSRTAFLAKIPAPNITDGFDVFVDEAMAAMTTEPCFSEYVFPSSNVNFPLVSTASADSPKPLKPTYKHESKSMIFLGCDCRLQMETDGVH